MVNYEWWWGCNEHQKQLYNNNEKMEYVPNMVKLCIKSASNIMLDHKMITIIDR